MVAPAGEIFDYYGGEAYVIHQCSTCPANIPPAQKVEISVAAGCFGLASFPANNELVFHLAFEKEIDRCNLRKKYHQLFTVTKPASYGLWIPVKEGAPLTTAQASLLLQLLSSVLADFPFEELVRFEWHRLLRGLEYASQGGQISLSFYPAGRISGREWFLEDYCKRCKAPWPPQGSRCPACEIQGFRVQKRKRLARGDRPFVPIGSLLEKNVADHLRNKIDLQIKRDHEQAQ
ncbi:MAG: hypothetical protein MPJ24_07665 [Pirellulaceae bacterium]|nr:hypothetical protein [Pirellulaceae bacterium]